MFLESNGARLGARPRHVDLTFCNTLRQIRLAVPIAAAAVHAAPAGRQQYNHRTAVVVLLCSAPQNSNAFENSVYRKSQP